MLVRLATDFLFMCSTRNASLAIATSGTPVFLYYFTHSPPPHTDPTNPPYCSFNGSVCHGASVSPSTPAVELATVPDPIHTHARRIGVSLRVPLGRVLSRVLILAGG